jgi:hypothetical protein
MPALLQMTLQRDRIIAGVKWACERRELRHADLAQIVSGVSDLSVGFMGVGDHEWFSLFKTTTHPSSFLALMDPTGEERVSVFR